MSDINISGTQQRVLLALDTRQYLDIDEAIFEQVVEKGLIQGNAEGVSLTPMGEVALSQINVEVRSVWSMRLLRRWGMITDSVAIEKLRLVLFSKVSK